MKHEKPKKKTKEKPEARSSNTNKKDDEIKPKLSSEARTKKAC